LFFNSYFLILIFQLFFFHSSFPLRGNSLVPASELLAEADKLKSQLTEESKAKEAHAQEVAKMQAELAELRALKDQVVAKQKADEEAYAAAQLPKYEAYVAELAASKVPLTDVTKKDLKNTFCNPKFADGANYLWAKHTQEVELKASLKTLEERAKAAEEAKQKLEAAVNKTTQVLNHSRSEFAASLSPKDAAKEDESRRKTNASSSSLDLDVNASGSMGGLSRIMNCEPSLAETEIMQTLGFSASSGGYGVNASSSFGGRQRISSLPVVASSLLKDEEGQLNNPGSANNSEDPGHKLLFSFMCHNPHMHGDLSDIVKMKEDKNNVLRREAKHPMMIV
jgi:hypothetical protein